MCEGFMSHIIGKVYDVTPENMNKLIAELEEAKIKIYETVINEIASYSKMLARLCKNKIDILELEGDK